MLKQYGRVPTPSSAGTLMQHRVSFRAGAASAQVDWPSGSAMTFLAATPVGTVASEAMVSAANAGRTERQWPA